MAARYSLSVGDNALAIFYATQGISSRANELITQHDTSKENRNLFYQFIVDEKVYLVATNSYLADLLNLICEKKHITLVSELVIIHDLRRTGNVFGVPNKTQRATLANGFPQRFLYPQSELNTNSNIPDPIPTFFQTTTLF